jgi:murein DD-endopeptidase MepM/ murein hydrolase activator NlpD
VPENKSDPLTVVPTLAAVINISQSRRHHAGRPLQARLMVGATKIARLFGLLLLLITLFGAQSSASAVNLGPPTGFVLPVSPPPLVLTPFDPPASKYGSGHRGVDLAGAQESIVVAAGPGSVVFTGQLAGRGVISIEHTGGLRTTYEPVTATVSVGGRVVAGQQIGLLQTGHASCAPVVCLHWGARLADRVYLDPMSLLTAWRVRLLPWAGRGG